MRRHRFHHMTTFWGALVLGLGLMVPSICSDSQTTPEVPCLQAADLEHLIACIQEYTPTVDSDGYRAPGSPVRRDWRSVVRQMLTGACDKAVRLPENLRASHQLSAFTDTGNRQRYCVLLEVADHVPPFRQVDRGWGTFMVNPHATRELHIQIPHPQYERGTAGQGIGLFKALNARSLLMAGAHRHANPRRNTCQKRYREADTAHNDATLFHAAAEALHAFYEQALQSFAVLQFHGMAYDSCKGVDIYMTYGQNASPSVGDPILVLRDHLAQQHSGWAVRVPGERPTCSLHGSRNVQGRLFNGVPAPQVCDTPASDVSKRFIHIEQAPGHYRDPDNWVAALAATFTP